MSDVNALATKVMSWCDQLAAVSASTEGISRFYLTPEHQRCNNQVGEWMRAAGMNSWSDTAGNLRGRYPAATQDAKILLLGSHLDSIPNAGRYDGILGVLIAIAAVEQMHLQKINLPFALEIIGFGDEEGVRFGSTLLGSRAVAGTWQADWWKLEDDAGISLTEAFEQFGLDSAHVGSAALKAHELLAYLEVHIEQGPVLENINCGLGIVSAIAGARRFKVEVQGYAGHAGTVPMPMRRDALIGAALGVELVERIAREQGVVATVGQLQCWPGAINVVPGRALFSVDIRSGDDILRDRALGLIQQAFTEICLARQLSCRWIEVHTAPAVVCADWLQELQAETLISMGLNPVRLMSGAGHDAMAMAEIADVGMYFVRCKGGVSHHPDESVTVADVALAIAALTNTLVRMADRMMDK